MKSSQWDVLGSAFLLLMILFIYQDTTWENICNLYDFEEPLDKLYQLRCVQVEVFDPFIYLFATMWIVCWINGWIESRSERRK